MKLCHYLHLFTNISEYGLTICNGSAGLKGLAREREIERKTMDKINVRDQEYSEMSMVGQ